MTDIPTWPEGLQQAQPLVWRHPGRMPARAALIGLPYGRDDVAAAVQRWQRFGPLLARLFPDALGAEGHIDSPLLSQPDVAGGPGDTLWIKADHALPITACIKARGGVFEVLGIAEDIATAAGLLPAGASTATMAEPAVRELLSRHRILVGSTGNLGYSVGVMGRALGLQVEVHLSHDAQAWKKDRLRAVGATVVEHEGDYARAVAAARALAEADAQSHFIDDETSLLLFFGYAAAAEDLHRQLQAVQVQPTEKRPLRVYLPCGVGGAPGGVAFGLKCLWGDAVQVVFVEPVAAPCFLVRLASDDESLSVYDLGLDNRTVADGLAVARASETAAALAGPLVDAVVTVSDQALLAAVRQQWTQHGLRLEPSAAAGFVAHAMVQAETRERGRSPLGGSGDCIPLVWTTGGDGLPDEVFLPWVA
jgi:D-serine dehydratase